MSRPHSPQRILLVGAGGFGREVFHWARAAWPEWHDRIAGFLAGPGHSEHAADRSGQTRIPSVGDTGLPILADPADYAPRPGDALLLAIGIPGVRRRVAEALAARGAEFLTLVHPTAVVSPTATLGSGTIVCPQAVVSDSAVTGRCVLVNYHASLAHDATAGDFAVLSPSAALAGAARVGADAFLGLHASVGPGVVVGERSKVAANSCALNDVPPDSLVHGVPGRVTPLL